MKKVILATALLFFGLSFAEAQVPQPCRVQDEVRGCSANGIPGQQSCDGHVWGYCKANPTQPRVNCSLNPCVVIYADSNFSGDSRSLPIGNYRLNDFNDVASSIRVLPGLVAIIYEHADFGGGYGTSVDLLEDHNDLTVFGLNDKVSYVSVFKSEKPGFFWARNSRQNGTFVAGHWQQVSIIGMHPINIVAVVAPPLPPHGAAPFDLVSDVVDDNFILKNPKWGWQVTHGARPDPVRCDGGSEKPPFRAPCVSSAFPDSYFDTGFVCEHFGPDPLFGVAGHANWMPATYVGRIIWDTHSHPCDTPTGLFSADCDDDYNLNLYTLDDAGATTAGDFLHCEFDSDETIDHFDTPWWNSFHDAVDNSVDDFDINERYFKERGERGRYAIVTGLLGLEMVHGGSPELHPVWAIAIRVEDSDPADEVWAIFVRRSGDEGFCSGDQHTLYPLINDTFTFRLPWRPGATDVQIGDATIFKASYDNSSGTAQAVQDQGLLVSFSAPSGGDNLLEGELHLRWPGGREPAPIMGQIHGETPLTCMQGCPGDCAEHGLRTKAYNDCMLNCKNGCRKGEQNEPGRRFAKHLTTLTQPQRLEISMLNPPSPRSRLARLGRMNLLARLQSFPIRGEGSQTAQSRSVPDTKKRTRDQRLIQTLRKFPNVTFLK
jgi:hypothetical protein